MKKFFIAVLLISAFTVLAYADTIYRLPTTIVSADRFKSSKKSTSYRVRVISSKEIDKLGLIKLPDILNYCSNLISLDNGYNGSVSSISMRGGFTRDVVVMLDGIPINSSFNGSPDMSIFSIDAISRIEIVEGPISAMYGSGSISGIINIITKKWKKNRFSIEIKNRNSLSGAVSITSPIGAFFFSSSNDRGWRSNTDFKKNNLLWKKNFIFPVGKLDLMAGYSGYSLGVPGPMPDSNFIPEFGDSTATSLYDNQLTNDIFTKLSYYFNLYPNSIIKFNYAFRYDSLIYCSRNRSYMDSSVQNNFYRYMTITNLPELTFLYSNKSLQFSIGGNSRLENNQSQSETYSDTNILVSSDSWKVKYNTYSAFQEAKLKFIPHIILENKLRYDYVSLKKDTISRKFNALSYSFGTVLNYKILIMKANYGTAFKNPGLNDLFFPYMGNPDLKPEKSKEFSILLGTNLSFLDFNISYFSKSINDLIYWSGMAPSNINSVNIKGIEGELDIITEYITLMSNITYQNSISHDIIDTTNVPVDRVTPYSPSMKVSYNIAFNLPYNITLGNSGTYLSSYVNYFKNYYSGGIDTVKTNNVFLLNAKISKTISNINIAFSVENLLDYRGIKSFGYSPYDRGYPYNGKRIKLRISSSF